jgi:hypothetical protein
MKQQPQKSHRPSHHVYVVEGEGEKAFWTRIGAAWPSGNDGLFVVLNALPLDGRLVIRKPKSDASREGGAA